MSDVVVGVDGSAHSLAAMHLAAQEARYRSGRLHVVHVYAPSQLSDSTAAASVVAAGTGMSSTAAGTLLRDSLRRSDAEVAERQRHAEGWLRQFVAHADVDLHGLDVAQTAVSGEHPAAALVRLSRNADLLVVGSRGRGGFVGLLVGSVSQQCVHHAECPVLVVRPSR